MTIRLDDDLYALAKAVSKSEDCSLSAAVNRLLRRAMTPRAPKEAPDGFPIVRCHTRFTAAEVERLELSEDTG